MVTLTNGNTMIFKHKSTRRGYGDRILMLIQLCFLTALIARNVSAYPQQTDKNEGSTVRISDASSSSERDQAENDFEGSMMIDEQSDFRKRVRRDTLSDEDTDLSEEQGMTMNYPRQRRLRESDQIVFPNRKTERTPSCEGSTYCEHVDSYPEDAVNRALQRNGTLRYLANVDVIVDIAQRVDVADDAPLCLSTEEVVYPREAMNKDEEWKVILNQQNFKQGVRIEKCSQESSRCMLISDFAQGYKTSCKQKYVYKQLVALSDNKVVQDNFKIPASCCCHVSFNGSPLTRIGLGTANSGKGQVTPAKTIRTK